MCSQRHIDSARGQQRRRPQARGDDNSRRKHLGSVGKCHAAKFVALHTDCLHLRGLVEPDASGSRRHGERLGSLIGVGVAAAWLVAERGEVVQVRNRPQFSDLVVVDFAGLNTDGLLVGEVRA